MDGRGVRVEFGCGHLFPGVPCRSGHPLLLRTALGGTELGESDLAVGTASALSVPSATTGLSLLSVTSTLALTATTASAATTCLTGLPSVGTVAGPTRRRVSAVRAEFGPAVVGRLPDGLLDPDPGGAEQ